MYNLENIVFISYYTPGYYEQIINKYLIPSLKKWNLDSIIEKVVDRGKWIENVKYKSEMILNILQKTTKDIIFLDADAEILALPILFKQIPKTYDLAVHFLDWYKFWHNQEGGKKLELLSGTLLVRNNLQNKDLIKKWSEQTIKSSIWEQKILEDLLPSYPNISIYKLPIEYCQIIKFDGLIPKNTIIAHHQASRGIKK